MSKIDLIINKGLAPRGVGPFLIHASVGVELYRRSSISFIGFHVCVLTVIASE